MTYATIKLLVAFTICMPCLAQAQPAPAGANAEARRLLEDAKRAYDNGQFAEALARYDLSYQLEPSPRTLFLVAQAADGDGQAERAVQAYRAYLRAAPTASNKAFVSARITSLRKAPAAGPVRDTRATATTLRFSRPSADARPIGRLMDTSTRGHWSADDEAWFRRNRGFRNAGKLVTAFGGLLCLTAFVQMSGPSNSAFGLGTAGAAIYGVGSLLWAASAMYGTNEMNRRGVRVSKVGAIMSVVGIFGPPMLWIAGPMQNANIRRAHDSVASTRRAALDYAPGLGFRATF
jgi:tetratricopeptide (TPR) repeat protein